MRFVLRRLEIPGINYKLNPSKSKIRSTKAWAAFHLALLTTASCQSIDIHSPNPIGNRVALQFELADLVQRFDQKSTTEASSSTGPTILPNALCSGCSMWV